ncbi:MAG: hypothetical protein DMF61_24720 [Blastocatellia bacterium AA13]|nr:MAG: hypothetical protein DMF61_24720 [Blastocatellia bacterium AA13]
MAITMRIALELRHQYSIAFYPTSTNQKAKWHKIKIKLEPPKGLGNVSLAYKDAYRSFDK